MADDKTPTTTYQTVPRKDRIKQHFRRFWWAHLVEFLAGVLIITLILVYVAMPRIAQDALNQATLTLTLTSEIITNPTKRTVHVRMTTVAHSTSQYHPMLGPFVVSLFLEDTEPTIIPFGYLTIPQTKVTAASTIVVDQVMQIVDVDQFARYNLLVLQSKQYRVGLRGRMGLKQGGFLKINVDFNKVITTPGKFSLLQLNHLSFTETGRISLDGFKSLQVRNISISLLPADDRTNMHGQIYINNPSPISISMGTVTQNIFVDGQNIGLATIPDLSLVPGDNLIPMTSASNQSAVLELVTTKYTDGVLPVSIVGNSSIYDGTHIAYFEKALGENRINTTLDLGPALVAIGLNITTRNTGKRRI